MQTVTIQVTEYKLSQHRSQSAHRVSLYTGHRVQTVTAHRSKSANCHPWTKHLPPSVQIQRSHQSIQRSQSVNCDYKEVTECKLWLHTGHPWTRHVTHLQYKYSVQRSQSANCYYTQVTGCKLSQYRGHRVHCHCTLRVYCRFIRSISVNYWYK